MKRERGAYDAHHKHAERLRARTYMSVCVRAHTRTSILTKHTYMHARVRSTRAFCYLCIHMNDSNGPGMGHFVFPTGPGPTLSHGKKELHVITAVGREATPLICTRACARTE